jgi:hypothetical protein
MAYVIFIRLFRCALGEMRVDCSTTDNIGKARRMNLSKRFLSPRIVTMALLLLLSSCSLDLLGKAEKERRMEIAFQKAIETGKQMNALWKEALTVAMEESRLPPADAAACGAEEFFLPEPGELQKKYGVSGPNALDMDKMMRNAHYTNAEGSGSRELVLTRTDLTSTPGPTLRYVHSQIDILRTKLKESRFVVEEELVQQAEALASPEMWTRDLTVMVVARTENGKLEGGQEAFTGDFAVGRSYVFDYREKRIVCAGAFAATNSEKIEIVHFPGSGPGTGESEIRRDLMANALAEGKRSLRSANLLVPADPVVSPHHNLVDGVVEPSVQQALANSEIIGEGRCLALPPDTSPVNPDYPSPLNSNGTPKRFGPSPTTAKGRTVLFRYDDFGPQAQAHTLIGMSWPTWEAGGSFAPGDVFDIRVVVYRGVSKAEVAARFKTVEDKSDHRIVSYDDAIAHIDAAREELREFSEDTEDGEPFDYSALIAQLTNTRLIITTCLGD